jgi:hypothetical protein
MGCLDEMHLIATRNLPIVEADLAAERAANMANITELHRADTDLAALVRRRDSETCATCDNQLPALDDHLFDRCSVPETAVLCWSMGNFCGAWKGKAQP